MLRARGIPVVEGGNLHDAPIDMVVGYSNVDAARDDDALSVGSATTARSATSARFPRDNDRARDRAPGLRNGACAAARRTRRSALCIETTLDLDAGAAGDGGTRCTATPRPRAVFCSADALAVGALFECQRRGLAVPRRIAIAGFDDIDSPARSCPRSRRCACRATRSGRRAGMLLCDRLAGRRVAARIVDVGYRLIERDSA